MMLLDIQKLPGVGCVQFWRSLEVRLSFYVQKVFFVFISKILIAFSKFMFYKTLHLIANAAYERKRALTIYEG